LFKKADNTNILIRHSPLKTTEAYKTYWHFAKERQDIFMKRILGKKFPWTNDNILRTFKFTNAFRASDRVSQYLIKKVIYSGSQSNEEVFFRILLFKLFNKIETWELLESKLGDIVYEDFSYKNYDKILSTALINGKAIYSAAYMMASGKEFFKHERKHQNHLELLNKMMKENVPNKISESRSLKQVFEILLSYPTIGDFLAYQYTIDLNYSNIINFSENEFVIPGPGALSGIKKCFSDTAGLTTIDIIKLMTDSQEEEFNRFECQFQNLFGRDLMLIDCQNLFCETDKYTRVSLPQIVGLHDRKKIKQKFLRNVNKIEYWYPPKWGINSNINKYLIANDK